MTNTPHPAPEYTLETTLAEIAEIGMRAGPLKKLAATIKRDQALADALWASGGLEARLVAVLIMERPALTQAYIDALAADLGAMEPAHRSRISEWLLANQLTKHKSTQALLDSWIDHRDPILRRLFWYAQARKRWTGRTPPPDNSAELLDRLTRHMAGEHPDVQWAMNFCAGWIGVFEREHRAACLKLGEEIGLYKGQPVAPNCTPDYLPEFIRIEVEKRA